jgi:hypothetical protein
LIFNKKLFVFARLAKRVIQSFLPTKCNFVVATQKGCAKGLLFCRQNNTDNMSEYQFADWQKTATDLKSCEK